MKLKIFLHFTFKERAMNSAPILVSIKKVLTKIGALFISILFIFYLKLLEWLMDYDVYNDR